MSYHLLARGPALYSTHRVVYSVEPMAHKFLSCSFLVYISCSQLIETYLHLNSTLRISYIKSLHIFVSIFP